MQYFLRADHSKHKVSFVDVLLFRLGTSKPKQKDLTVYVGFEQKESKLRVYSITCPCFGVRCFYGWFQKILEHSSHMYIPTHDVHTCFFGELKPLVGFTR